VRQPESGAPQLALLDQAPWVRPGEELRLTLQVTDAPSDAVLSLDIHESLDSRSALSNTIDGEDLGEVVANGPSQPWTSLTRTGDGGVQISLTVGDGGAVLDSSGVYPVEVTLSDAGGTVLTRLVTYLLLLPSDPEGFPPLQVALLVEIGAPPALQPDGTVALDDDDLARVDERTQVLTQVPGNVARSVAPVPETLDALADSGASGQERLQALQIATSGHEILARPYGDLDLGSLATTDLLTEVPPAALEGATVVRTHFNTEPRGGIWLTGPTVGQEDIAAIQAISVNGVDNAVVPQEAIASVPGDLPEGPVPTAPVALAEGGPMALVVDDSLSERLQGNEGALDAQRFLAELATIWMTRPAIDRGVVVRIPADADIDPDMVVTALEGLTGSDAVRSVSVSQMFEGLDPLGGAEQPTVVELAPDEAGADLSGLAIPLRQAQAEVNGLALTLTDRREIASVQRSLRIALGSETPDDERRAYIARADDLRSHLADDINAAGITITLTARDGTIPLTITNDSGHDVDVRVRLRSSQLEFPGGTELQLTAVPGQTREDIRVRTRTSGAFSLEVEVTSPDGTIVLDEATFTVRSTTVSGVGLLLSGGAGLFLLIWWARHWRSARRSRRLVTPPPDGHDAGSDHQPPTYPGPTPPDRMGGSRSTPATVARHAGSHRHRFVE
jgi:hypothetical protein